MCFISHFKIKRTSTVLRKQVLDNRMDQKPNKKNSSQNLEHDWSQAYADPESKALLQHFSAQLQAYGMDTAAKAGTTH